jgi:hypothetical protein
MIKYLHDQYLQYHAHLATLEIEIDNMRLGRLRDQTQVELHARINKIKAELHAVEALVPHVAPVEKSPARIEREQAQAQRELAAKEVK